MGTPVGGSLDLGYGPPYGPGPNAGSQPTPGVPRQQAQTPQSMYGDPRYSQPAPLPGSSVTQSPVAPQQQAPAVYPGGPPKPPPPPNMPGPSQQQYDQYGRPIPGQAYDVQAGYNVSHQRYSGNLRVLMVVVSLDLNKLSLCAVTITRRVNPSPIGMEMRHQHSLEDRLSNHNMANHHHSNILPLVWAHSLLDQCHLVPSVRELPLRQALDGLHKLRGSRERSAWTISTSLPY